MKTRRSLGTSRDRGITLACQFYCMLCRCMASVGDVGTGTRGITRRHGADSLPDMDAKLGHL